MIPGSLPHLSKDICRGSGEGLLGSSAVCNYKHHSSVHRNIRSQAGSQEVFTTRGEFHQPLSQRTKKRWLQTNAQAPCFPISEKQENPIHHTAVPSTPQIHTHTHAELPSLRKDQLSSASPEPSCETPFSLKPQKTQEGRHRSDHQGEGGRKEKEQNPRWAGRALNLPVPGSRAGN